jgi:hypothetical protein
MMTYFVTLLTTAAVAGVGGAICAVGILKGESKNPAIRFMQGLVDIIAKFVAAVLAHPAMQDAVTKTVVLALNGFIGQPDLHEHLTAASENLSKTQVEMARQAGRDFPKVVGSFFTGLTSKSDSKPPAIDSADQKSADPKLPPTGVIKDKNQQAIIEKLQSDKRKQHESGSSEGQHPLAKEVSADSSNDASEPEQVHSKVTLQEVDTLMGGIRRRLNPSAATTGGTEV